jgi:hypothetical protein
MRSFLRSRRTVLGLGLVAVLLGGAAVAVFVGTGSTSPAISGGAALRRVAASLKRARPVVGRKGGDLVSARVGRPPRGAGSAAAHFAVPAVYITERSPSLKDGDELKPSWEAELLLGAVAELTSTSRTLENGVGYAGFRGLLPNGTVTDLGSYDIGGTGRRQQRFARAHESDAAIERSVERVASRFGLSVDSLTIFHAAGAAPAVVLTAPNIWTVWSKFGSLKVALFGDPHWYQGFYLEIRGENGKPYLRESQSFRTGTGQGWNDPSVPAG